MPPPMTAGGDVGNADAPSNDLRREHPALYRAGDVPARLTVPPLRLLMIDGAGDPNTTPRYADAVGTLYAVSYGVRGIVKASGGLPWTVMPLEGLWWAEDMSSFLTGDKHLWSWTMMIMQPDWISGEMFQAALDKARAKLGEPPESLRLQSFHEGLAVQLFAESGEVRCGGDQGHRLAIARRGAGKARAYARRRATQCVEQT